MLDGLVEAGGSFAFVAPTLSIFPPISLPLTNHVLVVLSFFLSLIPSLSLSLSLFFNGYTYHLRET